MHDNEAYATCRWLFRDNAACFLPREQVFFWKRRGGHIYRGQYLTNLRRCNKSLRMVRSFLKIGDREKIWSAGFDNYISWPIEVNELPKLVERMLAG